MFNTVLVCGGREFDDWDIAQYFLDLTFEESKFDRLIHGAARGADTLANCWAISRGILVKKYPANWNLHKKGAGPIRNKLMLEDGKPSIVVAFPGGNGTAHMIRISKAANVPVVDVREILLCI